MASFTTEAFSLLSVGLFVIGLRTTARVSLVGFKGLRVDDYLMLVAAVRDLHTFMTCQPSYSCF